MTAYEIVDFLNGAGTTGVFELECERTTYFFTAAASTFEAVSDQTLKVTGRIGYGTLSMHSGSILLDTDEVSQIVHHAEGRA
jgi:hypothetical protein